MSHWTDTTATCKKCGARALRTSSGNQLVCSKYRDPGPRGCDWSVRTDGPTREECLRKFDEVEIFGTAPALPENHMFAAPPVVVTCKHPRLRTANNGVCPKGCP